MIRLKINRFNRKVIWYWIKLPVLIVLLIVLGLIVNCGPKYPFTPVKLPSESQIQTDLKKDLIAQAIVNKERSLLQEMFTEIMNGGTIIEKKVTGERYGDGTEVSVEEWTVKDGLTPSNTYAITWENGVLTDIVTLEKTKIEHKPLGKK